jgi:hypothetical protein
MVRFLPGGYPVPTRRIMELIVVTDVLLKPAFGTVRLWAHRTLGVAQPGSFRYGIAEVLVILT